MKRSILVLLLAILCINVFAQDKGIQFEHNTTWKQVLAKAKAENKYIMVDCHTTWCMPCKMLAKTTFTQEKVGKFYNDKFVNIKIQFDTTANDNDEVKSWYADARRIALNDGVRVYPTILFFNPEGKLVHRFVGYTDDGDAFVKVGEDALNPEQQYVTLIEKYRSNPDDTSVLHTLAVKACELYDEPLAGELSSKYLAGDKPLTAEKVDFILNLTHASSDKGFKIALQQGKELDKVAGEGATESMINTILFREDIYADLAKNEMDPAKINWEKLEQKVKQKYPKVNLNGLMIMSKMYVAAHQEDPAKKIVVINQVEKQYKQNVSPERWAEIVNDFAWNVATGSDDKPLLTNALRLSKESTEGKGIDDKLLALHTDTRAVLLYKLGKKDEAIAAETQAVELLKKSGADNAVLEKRLSKMKKGVTNLFEN